MKTTSKLWCALAASLLIGNAAQAQDAGFDLGSQRSESQSVLPVPGKKLDHHGIVVNPTPQSMLRDDSRKLDISGGFRIKDKPGRMGAALEGFSKGGVRLSLDYGTKAAKKLGVKNVSGAYALSIGPKGIDICGYDERGAFYALQTLRQIMESPAAKGGSLPSIEINDYPDLPNRGVVEGFYGTPWSHKVRLSLIDFYGKFKLNTYQYGPKDDPFHSSPNWREPYPEKQAAQIKELVDACRRNYVNFVWAVHPGKDIKWNEEDYQNLLKKFDMMYALGVRSFAIYFDDISGDGTNPVKQVELLNRLDREFVKAKGDVDGLTICPTDYSKLWANPTPQGSLSIYGNTLDPSVKVFWTGDVVCSDLTRSTLDWVDSRIKRPAYYWWNFPVTDYARQVVMQGPAYGLDTTLTDQNLCGILSNPMEHGEASKVALYGVADYAWNVHSYNPMDSWERAVAEVAPGAAEAYRTFAINSCDTETGYRRAESWETNTFRIGDYTQQQYDALMATFEKVAAAPEQMEKGCANALLVGELKPWLDQFGKLGRRGVNTLRLVKTYEGGDDASFWAGYLSNRMSDSDRKAYEAHKSGTMKLQPFYEQAMDDMADGFYRRVAGRIPATLKAIGSFPTLYTTQAKLMFDNDTTTYYTSGAGQKAEGDWIGVDLGQVKDVWEVNVLQGRNSKDDVDYFDHAVLESSADGKSWNVLKDDIEKQYDVRWAGDAVKARYIRLRKLASDKRNWASIRAFEVNPLTADKLGFSLEAADRQAALAAFDDMPGTSYKLDGTLEADIPKGTASYTMLMDLPEGSSVKVSQIDKRGRVLSAEAVGQALHRFDVKKNAAKLKVEGRAEIFELVRK